MPKRDVEEVDDGIIVTYYFDNAITQQDLLYPECVLWKIPGFGLNETKGEPATPIRWDSFSLPANTRVSVEVIDSSYIDIPMQLSPARPLLINDDTIGYTLETVPPITAYDGFFPTSLIQKSINNSYRGVPLLSLSLSPLQYNCCQQIVRAYRMVKYKITFLTSYRSHLTSNMIDSHDTFLSSITINPTPLTAYSPSIGREGEAKQVNRDYLIVTNTELYSVVENFAKWKSTLGFRVHISTNDEWSIQSVGDTIIKYYENPDGKLYYLLIVGDETVIPAPIVGPRNKSVTDLYYVCMDSAGDCLPDIYYGRIPVNNTHDAEIIFDKIRAYEGNPILDTSFYNTGVNCAYFQDSEYPKGYADRRFAETSEEILNYLTTQGKTINRVYYADDDVMPLRWSPTYGSGDSIPPYLRKPYFSWDGDSSDIIEHINQGTFYVLHRDHGMPSRWSHPYFDKEHLSQLSNQNKLPIVFSINCLTGKYDESTSEDCLAEAFLKKIDGGCVAIYAATSVSYPGHNDALVTGMFDAIWPNPGLRASFRRDSLVESITKTPLPTYELGQILEVGMTRMQETWGVMTKEENKYQTLRTREIFHVFGDPSMQIYTDCPTDILSPEVCRIEDTIYVTVKDGDARISFYTPATNLVDAYYGTNICYHTYSDDVIVCISRHNYIPYIIHSNDMLYIQNETINENRVYSGNTIKVGKNVTNKKEHGDVIVNNGNVSITGKRVELQSGTKVSKNAILRINNP
jgi:hypothetical protein